MTQRVGTCPICGAEALAPGQFAPVMRRILIAVMVAALIALFLAGCSSWHGEAEVRFTNGSKILCPTGLGFTNKGVQCWDKNGLTTTVPWSLVAGYEAR